MGGVYHEPFEVGIVDEDLQQPLPLPGIPPAAEPAMDVFPVTVVRRQVAPWRTCAQHPKHGVYELPVIAGIASPCALPALEDWAKHLPKFV
jgi:hypothetical protein